MVTTPVLELEEVKVVEAPVTAEQLFGVGVAEVAAEPKTAERAPEAA